MVGNCSEDLPLTIPAQAAADSTPNLTAVLSTLLKCVLGAIHVGVSA